MLYLGNINKATVSRHHPLFMIPKQRNCSGKSDPSKLVHPDCCRAAGLQGYTFKAMLQGSDWLLLAWVSCSVLGWSYENSLESAVGL